MLRYRIGQGSTVHVVRERFSLELREYRFDFNEYPESRDEYRTSDRAANRGSDRHLRFGSDA